MQCPVFCFLLMRPEDVHIVLCFLLHNMNSILQFQSATRLWYFTIKASLILKRCFKDIWFCNYIYIYPCTISCNRNKYKNIGLFSKSFNITFQTAIKGVAVDRELFVSPLGSLPTLARLVSYKPFDDNYSTKIFRFIAIDSFFLPKRYTKSCRVFLVH